MVFWNFLSPPMKTAPSQLRPLGVLSPLPFLHCPQRQQPLLIGWRRRRWLDWGKGPATKSDEFLEKFQKAFDPPLIFGNNVANFLWQTWLNICEEIWWLDIMKCMHMISRDRDVSEGWGWGSTAVGNLSKNSSDLEVWPIPGKSFTKCQNLQHKFWIENDPRPLLPSPLGNFPKINPIWRSHPSVREAFL